DGIRDFHVTGVQTCALPIFPSKTLPERCSADSRSVFEGMVPVLTLAPPRTGSRSMMATRLPKYAACAAPFSPAGPEPITIKSYKIGRASGRGRGEMWGGAWG